jgi:hypothetical protein
VSRFVGLVDRAERLFEAVVTSPEEWGESRFGEWSEEIALDGEALDRETLRLVRRVLRAAARLRDFWSQHDASRPDDRGDWRTRVDISLGSRAWRPILELAGHGLDVDPTPELFEIYKERFAVVMSQRWMEGVGYDEWLEAHHAQ